MTNEAINIPWKCGGKLIFRVSLSASQFSDIIMILSTNMV